MSIELKGTLLKIGELQTFPSGFHKKEVILKTDDQYSQEISIEFFKDKSDLPDAHKEGDLVTIGININGRMWESPTGDKKWFNSLIGWKIVKDGSENTHNAQPFNETPATGNPLLEDDSDDNLPFK